MSNQDNHDSNENKLLIKFLEKTYTEINENIRFSEAKNAALITLNSALIAAGASKIFDAKVLLYWRVAIAIGTLLLFIPLVLSLFSFRAATGSEKGVVKKIYSVLNKKNKIEQLTPKYMYFSYISKHFDNKPDAYLQAIDTKCRYNILEQQMARQIVDLSGVAYRKFVLFNIAVKTECVVFSIGGLTALVIVLGKFFCSFN